MYLKHQLSILEFLKDHVTLKTGVMMLYKMYYFKL